MNLFKNTMRRALAIASLLAFLSFGALAATGPAVSLTDSQLTSPTLLCNATAAVANQVTCTVSPPSGSFAYITAVYFDVCSNGTGSAQNNVYFTLNGAGGFTSATNVWTYSFAATASICQHWGDTGSSANAVLFRSNGAGTPIAIVSPASATNNNYGIRVYGYFAQ